MRPLIRFPSLPYTIRNVGCKPKITWSPAKVLKPLASCAAASSTPVASNSRAHGASTAGSSAAPPETVGSPSVTETGGGAGRRAGRPSLRCGSRPRRRPGCRRGAGGRAGPDRPRVDRSCASRIRPTVRRRSPGPRCPRRMRRPDRRPCRRSRRRRRPPRCQPPRRIRHRRRPGGCPAACSSRSWTATDARTASSASRAACSGRRSVGAGEGRSLVRTAVAGLSGMALAARGRAVRGATLPRHLARAHARARRARDERPPGQPWRKASRPVRAEPVVRSGRRDGRTISRAGCPWRGPGRRRRRRPPRTSPRRSGSRRP